LKEDQFQGLLVSMKDHVLRVIEEKLADALEQTFPALTRREVSLPAVPNKAHAITGMRRAGKTCFLFQCLHDALAAGVARERLVYFNFEDERLAGMAAEDLSVIVEQYYRRFPDFRRKEEVVFCLDEIQVVEGWERFVRRIMDSEKVRVLLGGSSAKMLSREVATSMRGRALEIVVTPFSFREFLAARGIRPPGGEAMPGARQRSALRGAFDEYVRHGGFPEAATLPGEEERVRLLQGYVDTVLFRDVAERHGVGNLVALRAFVRQLLRNPSAALSVTRISNDFRSRGIAASKETLLAFLDYLEDAFLVNALPVHARSERRRQVLPRKLYLADHALAAAFSPAAGLDRGHLVENIVACELVRHTRDLAYFKTNDGLEVDFLATTFDGREMLAQVASDVSDADTLGREVRALEAAGRERTNAELWLLCEDAPGAKMESVIGALPQKIHVAELWRWLALAPAARF
jgi:predicted AAA+ superfamily ATPase